MDYSTVPVTPFEIGMGENVVGPGELAVPHRARLEDGAVVWEWEPHGGPRMHQPRLEESNYDALTDFLALRGRTGDEYLRFVARYGPLLLCEHGLPVSHSRHQWMEDIDCVQRPNKLVYAHFHAIPRVTGDAPHPSCAPTQRESVAQIEQWVDHLANLLQVGQWLRTVWSEEDNVPPELLSLQDVWGDVKNDRLTVWAARWAFGERLRHLLVITGVQPVVDWPGAADRPTLTLQGVGVLGLLALQLVSFFRGSADMRFCEACSEPLILTDRRGDPRFCGRTACKRERDRRRKERQRRRGRGSGV